MWTEKGNFDGDFWVIRSPSTSSRPHLHPLPYSSQGFVKEGEYGYYPWSGAYFPLANGTFQTMEVDSASNKALEKLYASLGQAESLRVAWLEREKALALVTTNLRRLLTIARAVKRRDPKIIRNVLRRNPKATDVIRQPASLWLEYHFGIVPTILDLHEALGVFGFEFPVLKLSASASTPWVDSAVNGSYQWSWFYKGKTSVKLTGRLVGFDSNVSLASRLGFGQPLSVAWEMTPFSWFVDYFVNVSQMLKNLEPRFPGLIIQDQSKTVMIRCSGSRWYTQYESFGANFSSHYMKRSGGWPYFVPYFSGPSNLKPQQASYIGAVLAQTLSGFIDKKKR